MKLSVIAAIAENGVIGRDGRLPWRISADLKRFKALTLGHPIVMGRRTWESIGRPLPGRRNIVITSQEDYAAEGCEVASSLDQALAQAGDAEEVFVIGGARLYEEALPRASRFYLTEVHGTVEGDTHFPDWDRGAWEEISRETHPAGEGADWSYSFVELAAPGNR